MQSNCLQSATHHKYDKYVEDAVVYLAVDSVNLSVLVLQFWAHVNCHVTQVADHRVHLPHVLLHLIFTSIICDPRFEYYWQRFNSATFLDIMHCLNYFTVPVPLLKKALCYLLFHYQSGSWKTDYSYHFVSTFWEKKLWYWINSKF